MALKEEFRLLLFGVSLAFVAAQGFAQTQARPSAIDAQMAAVPNLPVHKISPNDLIAVSVYDAPELTRTVRVGSDGSIHLPLLKKPVQADGLQPSELEKAIVAALREEQVIIRPIVTVTILEYNSRAVNVVGAVHKPVTFPVIGATRLLDALARAEGVTQEAGPDLLLTRNGSTTTISIRDLMSGDGNANVVLEGGEQVRVPEARKIYVVGDVKKPAAISIRDSSENSVLKILALVEGVTPFSANVAYIYRGAGAPGARTEIPVELKKILARKSPDVALLPDDIFYVPDRSGLRLTAQTAEKLSGLSGGILSALIYSGKL